MHDGTQGNAMTEIALAMAMGFFSIMVLTILSMGVGSFETKNVAAAALAEAKSDAAATRGTIEAGTDDFLVIFARGRFYDSKLKPIDPARVPADRRVILAVEPLLPMTEALAARARVAVRNLVVSTMDARWQKAIAGVNHGAN